MSSLQSNQQMLGQFQRCKKSYEISLQSSKMLNKRVEAVYEVLHAQRDAISGHTGRAAARVFMAVGAGFLATIKVTAALVSVDVKPFADLPADQAIHSYNDQRKIDTAVLDSFVDCGTVLVEGVIIAIDPTKLTIIAFGTTGISLLQCFRSVDIAVRGSRSFALSSETGRTASKVLDVAGTAKSALEFWKSGTKFINVSGRLLNGKTLLDLKSGAVAAVELANTTLAAVDVIDQATTLMDMGLIDRLCDPGLSASPSPSLNLPPDYYKTLADLLANPLRAEMLIHAPRKDGPAFESAR
jgi:hypothetical protein